VAKILVTGTAGFIGFHVARRLAARGDSVVGFDNVNDYYSVSLKETTGDAAQVRVRSRRAGGCGGH
jgi:nucleoside-diphosphate-sugar epimerase